VTGNTVKIFYGVPVMRMWRIAKSILALMLASCAPSPFSENWVKPSALERETRTWRSPEILGSTSRDAPLSILPLRPSKELTLRESISLALIHNPILSAFGWDVRAAEARVVQAGLSPNIRMAYSAENLGGPEGGDLFMRHTVRLSQVIELSGRRRKGAQMARTGQRLKAWDYEAKRLEVMTHVARRHIATVAARQRLELAEQTLQLVQQIYDIVDQQVAAGIATTAERDKAAVRVSIEHIALDRAQHKLVAARQALVSTWGGTQPTFKQAVGDLSEQLVVPEIQTLIQSAQNHARLARWSDEIEYYQRAVELARANSIPDVTAGGGMRYFPDADDITAIFELSVPLPLIDRNQGRVLEARYGLARARSMQSASEAMMREELANAHADLASSSYALITLREQTLPTARAVFEAAQNAFESGRTNFLDVLDAERTLVSVERRIIDIRQRYHTSATILEGLTAVPLEEGGR